MLGLHFPGRAVGFCAGLLVFGLLSQPASGQVDRAARVRGLNNDLLRLHSEASQSSPRQSGALGSQAEQLIGQRAIALRDLIQRDPGQALSLTFSAEALAELAATFPESAAHLESPGTWQGPVERWFAESADLRSSTTVTRIRSGGQTLDLYFAGAEPAGLTSGSLLQVSGVQSGGMIAVATSSLMSPNPVISSGMLSPGVAVGTGSASTSSTAPMCSTTGAQNTAVLLVTFPNVTLPSTVTQSSLNDIFFGTSGISMDGFLREASYGQTWAAGDVFGPYTLTGSYNSCSDVGGAVLNDAITAAVGGGANLQNYSRVFLVFPDAFGCGWAGFASNACSITSTSGSFNASMSYLSAGYLGTQAQGVSLAAHEIGHNLGLMHSGTISAGSASDVLGPLTSPGTETDLGDYWSTMGATVLGHYPAPQKVEVLGWMTAANYQVVQSSGTYTLQPLETSTAGLQALKIQRGTGNNQWLWIEYRQPVGNYDSTLLPQPFSGALIHYEDSNTALGHTYLPNFTPTDTSWNSPALAAGATWTDPYTNLSISVLSATSSGLTVNVTYGATSCTRGNPTVSLSPGNPSVSPGSSVGYSVALTNNDSAGCAAGTFNLSSGQPTNWSGTFSASAVTLNPGQQASVTMTKSVPAGTAPGTYVVNTIAASATSSGTGDANSTVVAPTLSVSLSVSGSVFTSGQRQAASITAAVLKGSAPQGKAAVTFTMTKPNGTKASQSATTGSAGTVTWNYKFGPRDPKGTYTVIANGSYGSQTATSDSVTFTLQ